MKDHKTLRIDVVDKKRIYRNTFRDHGHEENIKRSYELLAENSTGESIKYVYETADLFLRTKEALESQKEVTVQPYDMNNPTQWSNSSRT